MISLTGILSLLSALAATSYALSCTQCVSITSSSCSGSSVTCPSGEQCGSVYTETMAGGMTTTSIVRSCVPSSECNFKGGIGFQHGKINMVSSCCNTDNCNPTMPSFPTQRSNPNGVVCRSCISADSTWCYTPDTIQCTGDQNMCLLQTSKMSGSASSSTALRGCATKSICDLGSKSQSIGGLSVEAKYICTSGGISVRTVVLTPAIVCLLLQKLTMISLTGILSLLSALAATSYALSCTQCVSPISSSCLGSSVTCPSGYRCGSKYSETTIGGMTTTGIERSCVPSSECNLKGSIGFLHGQMKMASSCCNTDKCTPIIPSFPIISSDPNGVVCRSCISGDSTWCYTSDTIQCTGNENMCLLQTSKMSGSVPVSTAIRGCATKSVCDVGSQSYSIGGLSVEAKYICTSGGISVRTVVLTPAIVCLLLLKLFF
ncbi:uncharacterized protein LOC130294278 [Hyla sarda]|uniref:uncharacterized protein LOC130294278 n=1 Tax=Hyla sarda TaxID=327740 RepID=UPI0024C2CBBD|nr:uncharacterized protein LOC130294278 [Hyla sarda]